MTFDEWFHKEYEPADLQIKQCAERNEVLHIPATVYLEELKEAFEAGQKDREAQIEKMKCCYNCKHSRTEYEHCKTDKHEKWEMIEK
jgi:hypothetical protein